MPRKLVNFIDDEARAQVRWEKDGGPLNLRLNYDLSENSVVFDVGGYKGQWSSDIFSKYCCFIHVFEPVDEFAENIKKRFYKNEKIIVHKFGLSNKNKTARIALGKDASSTFKNEKNIEEIILVRAIDFIRENNIRKIDLMKINIEGGEYDLLENLIDSEFIKYIENIQVQFHEFVPNAEERMKKIQEKLSNTHYLTYQHRFIFENWKIKN